MAKKFETLRNKMSPERQQAVEKRVQKTIAEMPLADLRKARQLTQSQIGELLKISQASVSKMEGQTERNGVRLDILILSSYMGYLSKRHDFCCKKD